MPRRSRDASGVYSHPELSELMASAMSKAMTLGPASEIVLRLEGRAQGKGEWRFRFEDGNYRVVAPGGVAIQVDPESRLILVTAYGSCQTCVLRPRADRLLYGRVARLVSGVDGCPGALAFCLRGGPDA